MISGIHVAGLQGINTTSFRDGARRRQEVYGEWASLRILGLPRGKIREKENGFLLEVSKCTRKESR